MSDFPRSPKILKGALVAYQLPDLVPTLIVFQYNPDQVTRSLQGRMATGGGRGDAQRTDGPPDETISLSVEIDAADQLEENDAVTKAAGLHPTLASLENLMYPSFPIVIANQVMSAFGSAFILGEPSPLALLIWGPARILPVRVNSVSITEQAFDSNLNPIRAKVDLGMKVMTYRELDPTNPGYWVYMASFTQKKVMAGLNAIQNVSRIGGTLPL